jgi:HEAT repeat protein
VSLHRLLLPLLLSALSVQAQTPDIQYSPPAAVPLGAMVREAKDLLHLETTTPDPKNPQQFILKPIALLKGKKEPIRIVTAGGLGSTDTLPFLTWAEKPRRQAVYFCFGGKAMLCVGNAWFWLLRGEDNSWSLLSAYEPHRRSFIGSPATLVQHVRDLNAGKEVVVAVESPNMDSEGWFGHFGRDWQHGQHGPVCRVNTSLKDEAIEHGELWLEKDGRFREPAIVGEGFPAEELPTLLRGLESKDPSVRAAVAFDIGMVRPEARTAAPALRKALKDSAPFVRLHAALSLGQIEPKAEAELDVIRKALKDQDFEVRRTALGVLARLGSRALPAFDDVLKALEDEGYDVAVGAANAVRLLARDGCLPKRQRELAITALARALLRKLPAEPFNLGLRIGQPVRLPETAARALLAFGAETSSIVSELREALSSEREMVARLSAEVLARLDPPPVPILVEAIDREKRELVSGSLGLSLTSIGPGVRLAGPALRRKLSREQEPLSRVSLIRTLLTIEGKQALPELLPYIRQLAADGEALWLCRSESLRIIEENLPSLEGVEGLVRDALKDKVVSVRLNAARLLVGAGKQQLGLPTLLGELDSKEGPNRLEALADLEALGPKASAALPKLRKLAEDAKHPDRVEILTALWRVEDGPLDRRKKAIVALQQRRQTVMPFLRFDLEEGLLLGGTLRSSAIEEESLKTALGHFAGLLLSDPQAETKIGEALKSRYSSVRLSAVTARLALNDIKEVIPSVLELCQESPDFFWCVADDVASLGAKARALSPFLRRQLTSDNNMLFQAGRDALQKVEPTGLKGVWRIADLEPLSLSDKELDRCWQELADSDPAKAYLAECRLIRGGDKAATFLSQRLTPAVPLEGEKLARLFADLDSKRFAERERAAAELQKLGQLVEPALRKLLDDKPGLEIRRRVETLLERLEPMRNPDRLRTWLAVEALEHIGTTSAREHLRKLAGGAAGTPQTVDAKAALERIGS